MILIELFREHEVFISNKGLATLARAIKEIYPHLDINLKEDEKFVLQILVCDLPEEECLQILQLTARYAKLWLFS